MHFQIYINRSLTPKFKDYLKSMKNLQNPTTYFFKAAENVVDEETPEIRNFANKLLNK